MKIVRPLNLFFFITLSVCIGGVVAIVGAQVSPYGVWVGCLSAGFILWRGVRNPLRRWRVARRGFPQEWRDWLHEHVLLYREFTPDARTRFERDIQFFIDEQTFEALDGITLTDTLRLSVAAGAALLLHGREDWEIPSGRTYLFYPGRFDEDYYDGDYAVYDGMVHAQGPVILSVDSMARDWAHPGDGHNVVLHELAHLFDFENGEAEGVPSLVDSASATSWKTLVQREMQRIRRGSSLLRDYAATNPAEFFAVAVENFFDRPDLLKRRHHHLYEALVAFFNFDPSTRH